MNTNSLFQNRSVASSIDVRPNGLAGPQAFTRWMILGMALVAAYAVQAIADWRWNWLAALQEIEWYEQVTGIALTLLFAEQWRLAAARMEGATARANRLLSSHKKWGALVPLLLYLHADDLGHGYLRALSLGFLGLVCVGLAHPFMTGRNSAWLKTGWLVVHVTLAAMLIYLIGYHVFDAFYYE